MAEAVSLYDRIAEAVGGSDQIPDDDAFSLQLALENSLWTIESLSLIHI